MNQTLVTVLSGYGSKAPAAILVQACGLRLLLDAGGPLYPGQVCDWYEGLEVDAILVTHDQHEAFTMSDRIGVMREGKLIQVAPPREIYEKPATIDVAKFVGAANLLPGRVVSTGVVEISGVKFAAPQSAPIGDGMVMIRPERIHVGTGSLQATIERVTFAGSSLRIALNVGGVKLVAEIPNDENSRHLEENAITNIDVLPDAVRVLPLN